MTEEVLVMELFDATESEADGYRGVEGVIRVELLMVGSLLSWDALRGAPLRLVEQGRGLRQTPYVPSCGRLKGVTLK